MQKILSLPSLSVARFSGRGGGSHAGLFSAPLRPRPQSRPRHACTSAAGLVSIELASSPPRHLSFLNLISSSSIFLWDCFGFFLFFFLFFFWRPLHRDAWQTPGNGQTITTLLQFEIAFVHDAASTALASSKPAPSLRPRREVVPEANMAIGVLVLVVVVGGGSKQLCLPCQVSCVCVCVCCVFRMSLGAPFNPTGRWRQASENTARAV